MTYLPFKLDYPTLKFPNSSSKAYSGPQNRPKVAQNRLKSLKVALSIDIFCKNALWCTMMIPMYMYTTTVLKSVT